MAVEVLVGVGVHGGRFGQNPKRVIQNEIYFQLDLISRREATALITLNKQI